MTGSHRIERALLDLRSALTLNRGGLFGAATLYGVHNSVDSRG